ncbi:hypothetical protein [Chloroflexus sp.]|uniref:hypothetical protein n=1 Tax=Chloroflexus sp. TaxID=1904827 RepID=UPI002ACE57BF|nr:hypothetical protein [Chloroflexus sp.]
MDMAGLIALAQGIGVLAIAGLIWPLIAIAKHTRPRRSQRVAPPARPRRPATFQPHHEG